MNRRQFLFRGAAAIASVAVLTDAGLVEPKWLAIRHMQLAQGPGIYRFVHFSDLHYKGDREQAKSVVAAINAQSPEFVCFTGDVIENAKYLPEALEILSGIKAPLYGVPGNHDYGSRCDFRLIKKCFAATGGAWLLNDQRAVAGGSINLTGMARVGPGYSLPSPVAGTKNILLMHYPAWVKRFTSGSFDLLLAGHSHGGQVRIPGYGAIMVPNGVDEYDLGLFQTERGPLHVTSGIGWFPLPVRFNCRPEIAVIEV